MLRVGRYIFKRAETSQELEQIHRLNYRIFVEEIGQHPASGDGLLIDKFHNKNTYFVGLRDGRVVGMVSVHDQPPFSVASRLPDPSILNRAGSRPLEVRLLAVEPDERHSTLFAGLAWSLYTHAREHGYTDLYISGVTDRVRLYRRLGFEPLGPAVQSGNAEFVPMGVSLARLQAVMERSIRMWRDHVERLAPAATPVCLLPGPVTTSAAVRRAFSEPPIYHRGPEFVALFEKVRQTLTELTHARDVALFNGSGTLANEAVAATLGAEYGWRSAVGGATPHVPSGLILVNGEFGERLVKQAARHALPLRTLRWPWGQPWNLTEVEATLAELPAGGWVWGVHLESSTGVLNDLPGLVRLARARGVRVCADCISSLGAVPLDLSEVYLATGATGKSLGAYAGIALVFADRAALAQLDTDRLPTYLDVPAALATRGPQFTFPSPVLRALEASLNDYATPEKARSRYECYAALGAFVRRQLRELGLAPLAAEACASPVVTTFAPPAGDTAEEFVARCRQWGFAIGGQSGYLAQRRLVQIATMGAVTREDCTPLFAQLAHWLTRTTPMAG
jgi:aspartate aminotransferase-like enzyme/predicted N-acetyltransferase YhbS